MKLLFCGACHDVRKLPVMEDGEGEARCMCGATWGRYLPDALNAEWGSSAKGSHLLGIANSTLRYAIQAQEKIGDLGTGVGRTFEAFVIPDKTSTVKRKE